jgi:Flp pilus assembly protein TadG
LSWDWAGNHAGGGNTMKTIRAFAHTTSILSRKGEFSENPSAAREDGMREAENLAPNSVLGVARRIRQDQSGQMLIMAALGMAALMGFMALAVDVGLDFRSKRNMQIAADSAAVAGALDYKYNASVSSAQSAGQQAATANGVTNGSNGAVVTINIPPASGPNSGSTGFVEAIVSTQNSSFFGRIFSESSVTVAARSVATTGSNPAACAWALAKSGTDVALTGSGSIDLNCNLYDNSSSSNALKVTGSGSLVAKGIGIVGNYTDTGSGTISPKPTTGMSPVSNPLSLSMPTIPTGTCSSNCNPNFSTSSNNTLAAGTYSSVSNSGAGSLTIQGGSIINGNVSNTSGGAMTFAPGNYTINGNLSNTGSGAMTLGAGNYIVTGNLDLTASGSLTATGVTFFVEGSTTISGSGGMNLTAPTSGSYNGVLFFQPPSDSSGISITGSGSMTVEGIVDAPSAALSLTGSASATIYTSLIADSISVTGSGTNTIINNYTSLNSSSVLATSPGMAE